MATSALSAGFDYAHVRLVIHISEPTSLVDFAQESGRAGRDGEEAYSLVLLPPRWKPPAAPRTPVEERALYRYLHGQDCRRACLSEYLDPEPYWRQCQADEDVVCDVCGACAAPAPAPSRSASPSPSPEPAIPHTGSAAIQQKQRLAGLELSRYQEDLLAVQGTCLICRAFGDAWDHALQECWRRFEFFEARDRVKDAGREQGRPWIAPFHACYWCYNPQAVCPRADPESGCQSCVYADVVLPLCYGVFYTATGQPWFQGEFPQGAALSIDEFLQWCGQRAWFGGGKAIQGVRVAALALIQFELY